MDTKLHAGLTGLSPFAVSYNMADGAKLVILPEPYFLLYKKQTTKSIHLWGFVRVEEQCT